MQWTQACYLSTIFLCFLTLTLTTARHTRLRHIDTRLPLLYQVSWSLTSLFSTNMAISETNGHSLQRTPSSPLFSCPGLPPWSSCAQELFEIILFQQADATGPRLESILGHCERHALLHMAPKWFDHWTTWAGLSSLSKSSSHHVCNKFQIKKKNTPEETTYLRFLLVQSAKRCLYFWQYGDM